MINNISWTSYCYVLTYLLFIYYTAVVWYFYRKDILQLLLNRMGKRKLHISETISTPLLSGKEQVKNNGHNVKSYTQDTVVLGTEQSTSNINSMYQALADEIRAYLQQAGNTGTDREGLLVSIQQIIHKYPTLKNSAFQQSIDYLIVFELKNKCSTYLSIEEVSSLWVR